jgi:nitrogen fixation/metabolism regulation signal transduction histidine kinase
MRRLSFERRLFLLALAGGLPAVVVAVVLLFLAHYPRELTFTLLAVVLVAWVAFSAAVNDRVAYSMRSLANLLGALRDGDFSFRLRMDDSGSLGEVFAQVNDMAETLHEQRLGAMEATALLQKVISEIDVAIFAFDSHDLLRLINRAGEQLIRRSADQAIGVSAESLQLAPYLTGAVSSVTRAVFPGGAGLWTIRRGDFRESGQPHRLLVFSDITRPLREEELRAWQRLVRVLGHEINNSLTPVKSLSSSLLSLVAREPLPEDWREDVRSGLGVISSRCDALNRFTGSYARLARLPAPKFQSIRADELIRRVAALEQRVILRIAPGPEVLIDADPDQLEQMLINIIRNAADATLERTPSGAVDIRWRLEAAALDIGVDDEGLGLSNTANLFVPFFTTKPGGSGIGLFLSRQIAEAHGGMIALSNREPGPGCTAVITLPARMRE